MKPAACWVSFILFAPRIESTVADEKLGLKRKKPRENIYHAREGRT